VTEAFSLVWNWVSWLLTNRVVLLCVGGAAGTCARYFLSTWVGAPAWANGFPVGTFLINVSGSFILGAAFVVIRRLLPPAAQGYWVFLVGTGFCGGYTTFSTFEFETYQLWIRGSRWLALANVLGSVLAGFAGVVLGVVLAGLVLNAFFRR
jgi:CrcB protein